MLIIFITVAIITISAFACKKALKERKYARTSRDFFLHGEELKMNGLIATLVSSNMSLGNMVFICAMLGYFYGWSGVFWVLTTIIFLGIGFAICGKHFKRYVESKGNFGTIHDYISQHHDISYDRFLTSKFTAASMSIFSLLIALILEVHIGTMLLSHIFGVEQFLLVAVVIMMVAAYTTTSGFRTVVFTDIIQFFCMVVAILAAAWLINILPEGKTFEEAGYAFSVSGMITDVGWQTAVGLCFLGFFWLISTPDTWQRNCATRNIDTSIKGSIVGAILMCIFVVLFAIGGMYVKTNIEGLIPEQNISLLSNGFFALSDIFLLDYNSLGIEVNIMLTLVAIGLLMAAISTIDTFLIVVAHVFNVDLGLSLKGVKDFNDVEKSKLDDGLLLRGRMFIIFLAIVVFLGWLLMNANDMLGDPLSLFFVIYTVQFCLAMPVVAASSKRTQSGKTTVVVIIASAVLTLGIGFWGMLNLSDESLKFGLTPASWLAILPVIPITVGTIGYSLPLLYSFFKQVK